MTDFGTNPVPLGRANTGAAVVFGDGLGALHWLQKVDQLDRARKDRAQAVAAQQQQKVENDLLTRVKFNTDGGVHYQPTMYAKRQDMYSELEAITADRTKSRVQKQLAYQQKIDDWNAELAAGKQNDEYLASELRRVGQDKRYNTNAASQLLTNSLFKREADGSLSVGPDGKPMLVPALEWNSQATTDALGQGNAHLVGNEVYGHFLDDIPESSVTYSREPLPGGRGYKQVAKSNIFELTPEGTLRRDPKTNRPVLRDSPETLAAFESDPLSKQWLAGQLAQHQQVLRQATEKGNRGEQLTPEEEEAVQVEASPAGAKMELFKRDVVRYGYGREEHALLQKAARQASGRTQGPKFTRTGGREYGLELVGGTAAGGTHGLLSLASSDPLVRVKADGSQQAFSARATHRQYVIMQAGQPAQLVTTNQSPQDWDYQKPQLMLTTSTGNVVTPTDPTLQQRFERGDKQPLLSWVRSQREAHPGYNLQWHFQAVPSKSTLSTQSQAQQIYERLVEERGKARLTPGQPGYRSDDQLHSEAQKLAGQQSATALIPYTGSSKRDIDAATGYLLREPARKRAMQQQFDYFSSQTAPRPAEQRPAAKKLGIDFGKPAPVTPAATPVPATKAATFKVAGQKKTGINFN